MSEGEYGSVFSAWAPGAHSAELEFMNVKFSENLEVFAKHHSQMCLSNGYFPGYRFLTSGSRPGLLLP